MIKINNNYPLDIDGYEKAISSKCFIYVDRDMLLQGACEYKSRQASTEKVILNYMNYSSGFQPLGLNRNDIYNFLVDYEHCPSHYFKVRGKQGFSLDRGKVLDKLYANNYAHEFLEMYNDMQSAKSISSKLKSVAESCHSPLQLSDGSEIYKLSFEVSQQVNLRYNYKSCDIISQIPRDFVNSITVPEGYVLVWGDFAQSDFRVAYNCFMRSEESDRLMRRYDDKYEALYRMIYEKNGLKFDEAKFKENRAMYKQLVLATVYGTRSSTVKEENEAIKLITAFLMTCPNYVKYYKFLQETSNIPLKLRSYFGYEQLRLPKYSASETVNDRLNAPVQTGTSELIINLVTSILKEARSRGLSEEDFGLYLTRHDEPIFYLKESCMDSIGWLHNFEDIVVDDWVLYPHVDFCFGRRYKNIDTKLMLQFSSSQFQVDVLRPSESKMTYTPVCAAVYSLGLRRLDGTVIATLYDGVNDRASHFAFPESTPVFEHTVSMLSKYLQGVKRVGYNAIYIYTTLNDDAVVLEDIPIDFIQCKNIPDRCQMLNSYAYYVYAQKNQIPVPVYNWTENEINSIKSVKVLDICE